MKGIIFNLLEEVVSTEYGEDTWDSLLDAAQLEGSYAAVGSYPDGEISKLVGAASSALNLPQDDILRWFGHNALPLLHDRYPEVFRGHTSTKSFLLTLNDVIHPEVRKLFPGAYAPDFEFETSDDEVRLSYTSKRRLCAFAEGLITGTAAHFGEVVEISQQECMKRGDDRCTLICNFKGS